MMVWLYKSVDDEESSGGVELREEDFPEVGAVFTTDGYPLLCVGHVERDGERGIVYGRPPAHARVLVPERVEKAAKESYAFSCSISGNPTLPQWENADELTKIGFLVDAEHNIVDPVPRGKN